MVKTPRTRHSKSNREPVTIDLEAEAVRREEHGGEAAAPQDERPQGAAGDMDEVSAAPEQPAEESPLGAREEAAADVSEPSASESPASEEAVQPGESQPAEDFADTPPGDEVGGTPPPDVAEREPRRGGGGSTLAAGVAGGVIALALGAGLIWADVVPLRGPASPDPAADTLRQEVAALQSELAQLRQAPVGASAEALEQALAQPRQEIAELRDTVTAIQSAAPGEGGTEAVQALEQRLADMESRVASLAEAATAAGDTGELAQRVSEFENLIDGAAEAGEAARQATAANAQRIEQLAGEVAELREEMAREDEGPRLALVVAAMGLRSAIERGTPFRDIESRILPAVVGRHELAPLRKVRRRFLLASGPCERESQLVVRLAVSRLQPDRLLQRDRLRETSLARLSTVESELIRSLSAVENVIHEETGR
jgi:hypothetical protein